MIPPTEAASEERLGLKVQNLTPELARQFGLDEKETGVLIVTVQPGSAADEAQIRPGDILSELNRREIRTVADYRQALESARQDRMLLALVKREGNMLYTIIKTAPEK